jgi:imidazolonepropionase-like amidohydrolase
LKSVAKFFLGSVAALTFTLVLLIQWPQRAAPLPPPGQSHVVDNVRIVDVETGIVGQPTSVTIRNGIIVAIDTARGNTNLPRIDGNGAYAVSGFWDMHSHSFQNSPQMHFPLWIANGVTSVRDMMDCPKPKDSLIACAGDKRRWNKAIEGGMLSAPRIVETASYYLESPDLTPDQAIVRVRDYKARGIDAVKVYNRVSRPAYFAAALEARVQGMRIVGHLPKAVALDEALAAGQTSFEHAHLFPRHCFGEADAWRKERLDAIEPAALVETMVARFDAKACDKAFESVRSARAWFVPTHVTREEDARAADPEFAADPRLNYLDPLSRWAWNDDLAGTRSRYPGPRGAAALTAYFDHGLRLTGAAHKAGVSILVGTDTAIGGFRYHDEMGHLVRGGLSPAEVLRAATIDSARYARRETTEGSITIGKRADLVLLLANPLDNIANTRRIAAVFQNGRHYDRVALDRLLAFTRREAGAPDNWAKLIWAFLMSEVSADL